LKLALGGLAADRSQRSKTVNAVNFSEIALVVQRNADW